MLFDADTLGFVGVAAIVVITPGPDMALVTTHALGRGRDSARRAAIGVNTGILVHAAAAALGLSALLVASSVTFTVVKVVGAAFLIYLGVRTLLDARKHATARMAEHMPSTRIAASPFWQGFWSNVLNPKVALLFISLLPQFLDADDPILAKTLVLSALFLAMGIAWLLAYAALVSRAAGFFRSDRVRRRVQALSGAVLVALGVRIAVQDA